MAKIINEVTLTVTIDQESVRKFEKAVEEQIKKFEALGFSTWAARESMSRLVVAHTKEYDIAGVTTGGVIAGNTIQVPQVPDDSPRGVANIQNWLTSTGGVKALEFPKDIELVDSFSSLMILDAKDKIDGDGLPGSPYVTLEEIIPYLINELDTKELSKWIEIIDEQAREIESRSAALRIASMVVKAKCGKSPIDSPDSS